MSTYKFVCVSNWWFPYNLSSLHTNLYVTGDFCIEFIDIAYKNLGESQDLQKFFQLQVMGGPKR